jgi:ABC-type transporter Mla subunit MlaD
MNTAELMREVAAIPKRSVEAAAAAPQVLANLYSDVGELVYRAGHLLDRLELLLARAEKAADEVESVVLQAHALEKRVATVTEGADHVGVAAREATAIATEQATRLQRILDLYEPLLRDLAPLARETSRILRPSHLKGLAALLDELPPLVDRFEPALQGMANLTPEMENVTEKVENVGEIVEGVPGAGILKRRGKARDDGPA